MDTADRQRFIAACHRLQLDEDTSSAIWEELSARYSEAHRHYHNLNHIGRMIGELDACRIDDPELELAVWFHDVIYDPRRKDNEVQSASFFENRCGALIRQSVVHKVKRLILATDPTRSRAGNIDEYLMVDLDLSILGSPPEQYEAYRQSIRKEYDFVPDLEFAQARRSILQRFLSEPIYLTDHFKHLEEAARCNIQRELCLL